MKRGRSLIAAFLVATLGLVACAKTEVTGRKTLYGQSEKFARPHHIYVYDFAATPGDVPAESALASHAAAATTRQTPQQIALGREVGADVAKDLVADIAAMGLPAERGTPESVLDLGDLVIRGTLISIDAGSAVERVAIGFGEGNAELKTAVEGFLVTDHGLRKLGSGSLDSGDSETPGAAVPLAIAIHAEETGSSTIEGKAKDTAAEIAKQIKPRFQQQGWIPAEG
jgi:hypothetical protein